MNHLADERSPHLRQHVDDPIDWWPWGAAPFAEARRRDVPVLVSIGSSSCHWSHAMAREWFSDPAVAASMNDWFVNILVDRELHPDVDALCASALQSLTGSEGWPMTVFCDGHGRPFSALAARPQVPDGATTTGFIQMLERVHRSWTTERDEVDQRAAELVSLLARSDRPEPHSCPAGNTAVLHASAALEPLCDRRWGGFGSAPKFPQFLDQEVLLLASRSSGDEELLRLVTNSIDAMASGGIYDHLGGGIARSCADARWLTPRFEKMLDDNAQFTRLCLHTWQVTGRDRYLQLVDETIAYVLRDLRNPDGAFFTAQGADSEGVEGKFYSWTAEQIHLVLGDDAPEFCTWYGVSDPNDVGDRMVLHRPERGDLLRPVGVELSRQRLFAAREMRIPPMLDDKVLTEWNALMISALAEAALATANHQWLQAAQRAGTFLIERLRRPDGRWLRSWQDGDDRRDESPMTLGVANDLTAVVDAFTRLTEATGDGIWLETARSAADQLVELFWDQEFGGFFTTGSDALPLVVRVKALRDRSTPSANSAAAVALLRLSALVGDTHLRDRAEQVLELLAPLAMAEPTNHPNAIIALNLWANGFDEIVVPGDVPDLLDRVRARFLPLAVVAWGNRYAAPIWEGRDRGKAYVGHNGVCGPAANEPDQFDALLDRL